MSLPQKCPICSASSEHLSVITSHVSGNEDQDKKAFYSCERCGINFLYPLFSEEENNKFYEEEFESFMNKRDGGTHGWLDIDSHVEKNKKTVQRRLNYLGKYIEEPGNVLEIGCSSGFMLKELSKKGHSCVGVEPSKKFREGLIEQGYEVYSNLDELSCKSTKTFNLIVHFFVLEHVNDPREFINNLANKLVEGGTMVFEIPCSQDALHQLYDIPEFERFYWSKAHPWYFNRRSISYILKTMNLDYRVSEQQRYGFSNHFNWALKRGPGGEGLYTKLIGEDFEEIYKNMLVQKGYADTLVVEVKK